jgi:hypothetical protein
MWSTNYHIAHWHYEIIDGRRKRIIDEWLDFRKKKRGRKSSQRKPCIACGKPTLYVYCSVRCVNEHPDRIAIVEGRKMNGKIIPAGVGVVVPCGNVAGERVEQNRTLP